MEKKKKRGDRREEKRREEDGTVTDRGLLITGSDSWSHSITGGGLAEN